jgi:hypothetical protein
MPDFPEATSPALTANYHIRAEHIAETVAQIVEREIETESLRAARKHPHDVPGEWFKGPF